MKYTREVDVWSMGCIFAEMMSRKPLFPGQDYIDQLHLIMNALGAPSEQDLYFLTNARAKKFMNTEFHKRGPNPTKPLSQMFSEAAPDALDLLEKMLVIDPNKRISVDDALAHPYLASIRNRDDETVADSSFAFDFENEKLTKPVLQKLIWDEMRAFHPDAMEDDAASNGTNSRRASEAVGAAATTEAITPVTPVTPAVEDVHVSNGTPEAASPVSAPNGVHANGRHSTSAEGGKLVASTAAGAVPGVDSRQEAGEPAREVS